MTIGKAINKLRSDANLSQEQFPEYWTKPINDTLHTSILGLDTVKISDRVKLTLEHIK